MEDFTGSPVEIEKKRCAWVMDRPGSKGDFQCGLMIRFDDGAGVPLCPVHLEEFYETLQRSRPSPLRDQVIRLKSQVAELRAERSAQGSAHSRTIVPILDNNKRLVGRVDILGSRLAENSKVYFIRCGSQVKIGRSGNPQRRLGEIRSGRGVVIAHGLRPSESQLIYESPGHADEEAELHRRFKAYRTDGEWFRIEGELEEYIQSLETRRVRGGMGAPFSHR